MNLILVAVISLGVIGLISAVVLFVASKKFAVYEDPRIGEVAEVLPQANCGGCGYPGCSGFAEACVKAGSLEGKLCPVGGQPVMARVAAILGLESTATEPKVAVVRCNGSCEHRPHVTSYDGAHSCAIMNSTYGGETGCTFGCLGCGDCVDACQFNAIHMNPETGLPEVDENACTACGACAKACPRHIIDTLKILIENAHNGKNNVPATKALKKVVIDDTIYEISCAFNYLDYLKDNIKRLTQVKKYYDKMNSSNSEKQKNYYLEGMKMLFDKGETVENFEEIFEQFKQALINKNEQIDKLNAELKEIRKLKI